MLYEVITTADLVKSGCTVIIDAAFSRSAEREEFLALAEKLDCKALFLHLSCPPATNLARLDRRQQQGNDPSDGRREIHAQHAANFAEFPAAIPVVKIDSSLDVDYNVQQVLCKVLQP